MKRRYWINNLSDAILLRIKDEKTLKTVLIVIEYDCCRIQHTAIRSEVLSSGYSGEEAKLREKHH